MESKPTPEHRQRLGADNRDEKKNQPKGTNPAKSQNAEGHSENTLFNGLAAEYGSPCRIPMNMQWRLWLVYRFPKWESTPDWEFEKGAIMMGFQATHLSKTGFHLTPQSQVQEDDDHYPTEWIIPYGCMVHGAGERETRCKKMMKEGFAGIRGDNGFCHQYSSLALALSLSLY
ncbi:hypothetical protein SAY86_029735 [Trapa natans]|uniref:Uncharacterized protein n=1 Tax=Trapa natans TaxID=22666 RepID=A0AAN7M2N4_TRANT|nr:hypothetical protein SAY86_029735 [Trapa natans]